MTYCIFKRPSEDQVDYSGFESMADDSNQSITPLSITRSKCNRQVKCCNIENICNQLDKIVDSLLIITIHIFFISIFEPIFYLNYVVTLEYDFIMNKIIDETNILYKQYIGYTANTRDFIDTVILGDKYKTLAKLKIKKDEVIEYKNTQRDVLYIQGIIYSSCILGFILLLSFYKYIRKRNTQFCKILLENIVMILFLFIYEYIFFNNFILKYNTIDTAEINYYGLLNFINYTTYHPIT